MTCILSCHWSLCVYLPFSGERLNPHPQMFIRGGGVWVGCLVLGGWVPQNPKTPQPLINIPWLEVFMAGTSSSAYGPFDAQAAPHCLQTCPTCTIHITMAQ